MQSQLVKRQEKESFLTIWDWVLVVGVTLTPMNELRVWKLGPGEILLILWSLRYLYRLFTVRLDSFFFRFWLLFLPCISIGAAYCVLFYPDEADPMSLLTFALFAFVSIAILEGFKDRPSRQIRRTIYTTGTVSAFWYMFLYIYSRKVRARFLGASLWYMNVRFSGGANNPHHIATLLCAAIFINLIQVLDQDEPILQRAVGALSVFFCGFVSLKTKSSTLIVAIVITAAFFAYFMSMQFLKEKTQRWIATSVLIIVFAALVGFFQEKLYDYIFEWVESDVNGLERFDIFYSIGDMLRKGWLTGLGPGTHGMNGTIEFHNSYLEFLAMGGVIGLSLFILFSVRLFRTIWIDPIMSFCVIPFYAYGLGGFSMRRMSFWIIVSLTASYAIQRRKETGRTEVEPYLTESAGAAIDSPKGT